MSRFAPAFDPTIFDPRLLNIMQTAFDAAWALHDADFPVGRSAREDARQVLAKAIVSLVASGERNPQRLKHEGLRELIRHRN